MRYRNVATSAYIFIGLMVLPAAAFGSFHERLQQRVEDRRVRVQEGRDELRQELQERRDAVKKFGENIKGGIQERGENMREGMAARRTEMMQEIEKRRDEFKAKAQERAEEFKKKFGAHRAERIEQFFNQMVVKFEAAIDRLGRSADKVEEMINDAVEKGKDMASAKENLAIATVKIEEAEIGLNDAKAKYAELAKNPDAKKTFADVRTLVQGVSKQVKEAHATLVRTIADLRGGDPTSSTTPVVAPSGQ